MNDRFLRVSRLAAVALALLGCAGAAVGCGTGKTTQRHAELEWSVRGEMPRWTPAEWNDWEAELAAALDKPAPEPPLFPEAVPPKDDENDD